MCEWCVLKISVSGFSLANGPMCLSQFFTFTRAPTHLTSECRRLFVDHTYGDNFIRILKSYYMRILKFYFKPRTFKLFLFLVCAHMCTDERGTYVCACVRHCMRGDGCGMSWVWLLTEQIHVECCAWYFVVSEEQQILLSSIRIKYTRT